ncbi:LAMI_0D03884g1_1 [Lachancea mirantina]|uniref:LAMI_0D03884g1_1 n=1 Tax=Lachancea mirantina TaxID=1230905 RepID=A0A1G4JAN6_9SACH|nr:LAMI_0D03884g1_1 [Lachancea mirantina]
MSSFFRDNALGFKRRSNVFSKHSTGEADPENVGECSEGHSSARSRLMISNSTTTDTTVCDANMAESTPKMGKRTSSGGIVMKVKSVGDVVDVAESSDVLLDAFANAQKISSSIRLELKRSKSENQRQHAEIANYRTELTNLSERLRGHGELLKNVGETCNQLKAREIGSEESLRALSAQMLSTNEKVCVLQRQHEQLRQNYADVKARCEQEQLKVAEKQNLLVACRTGLQEEEECNVAIMDELKAARIYSNDLLERVLKNLDLTVKKESTSMGKMLKAEQQSCGELTTLSAKNAEICESLKTTCETVLKTFSNKLAKQLATSFSNFSANISSGMKDMTPTCSVSIDVGRIHKTLEFIESQMALSGNGIATSKLDCSLLEIMHMLRGAADSVSAISEMIEAQNADIARLQIDRENVSDLQRECHQISLQKGEAINMINAKDAEIKTLRDKVLGLKTQQKEMNELVTKKDKEIERIRCEVRSVETMFASQFAAQANILGMITAERNALKKKVEKSVVNDQSFAEESCRDVPRGRENPASVTKKVEMQGKVSLPEEELEAAKKLIGRVKPAPAVHSAGLKARRTKTALGPPTRAQTSDTHGDNHEDAFELPSSSSDDLEMAVASLLKQEKSAMRATRKKKLLLEDNTSNKRTKRE